MEGALYIGTSGWSYKHWRERFYPKELKPVDYLGYYAKYFDTTEINTSFYHLPRAETIICWTETVKNDFRFCPKISRYVTHIRKLNDPEETLPKFFDLFDPVKKRLGPVLIQLPPGLAFHKNKVTAFYDALKDYKGYHFALEARHESWFTKESAALLKEYGIAFVIADSGGRWPYAEYVTARAVYVRLHGPSGYDSAYPAHFLKLFSGKIKQWRRQGHTLWIYFNNDGHGYALDNARQLIELTR